jgi:NarL family two-component system sensor histidine kinase LiaS
MNNRFLLHNFQKIINEIKQYFGMNNKAYLTLHIFRFASLFIASVVYLLEPGRTITVEKTMVVFLSFLFGGTIGFVYKKRQNQSRNLYFLLLLESGHVSVLLLVTGGLSSPFVWYALNPIIAASFFLPLSAAWIPISAFTVSILVEAQLRRGSLFSFLLANLGEILTLLLTTLTIQLILWTYHAISAQSQSYRQQQEELFSAYNSLAESHQMASAISNFQRDTVSLKNDKDIYRKLILVGESVFPLTRAVVLQMERPIPPSFFTPITAYKELSSQNGSDKQDEFLDLRDRWHEFLPQKPLIGKNKEWIAMPIWLDNKNILAVFFGWVKPGEDAKNILTNFSLFITFAEQVVRSLHNLSQVKSTLLHLSSLYEAVEAITSRDDIKEVIDLFTVYARTLTGCGKVIFWVDQVSLNETTESNSFFYAVKGKKNVFPEESWYPSLLASWVKIQHNRESIQEPISGKEGQPLGQLICIPVMSHYNCFGMLAALQQSNLHNSEEITQTLSVLANLAGVAIERNINEQFADKMLVIEEQNRIANEIHDTISQNLFSVVYGIDNLIRQGQTLPADEHKAHLATARDLTAQTSKELRHLIYRLSPRHRGDETFVTELNNYVNALAELNRIEIEFTVTGKEEFLNAAIRKAFYRIIKEATGNAIRHGKSSKIIINLEIDPFRSKLSVKDNGIGFNTWTLNTMGAANKKLGLSNIRDLTLSLKGDLAIKSEPGQGTTVTSSVPTSPVA